MASLVLSTLFDLAFAPRLLGLVDAAARTSSSSKKSSKSMSSSSSSDESPPRLVPRPVPFLVAGCLVDLGLVLGAASMASSSEALSSSTCYFFFGGILINLFKV